MYNTGMLWNFTKEELLSIFFDYSFLHYISLKKKQDAQLLIKCTETANSHLFYRSAFCHNASSVTQVSSWHCQLPIENRQIHSQLFLQTHRMSFQWKDHVILSHYNFNILICNHPNCDFILCLDTYIVLIAHSSDCQCPMRYFVQRGSHFADLAEKFGFFKHFAHPPSKQTRVWINKEQHC